jgi:hypothetical protein
VAQQAPGAYPAAGEEAQRAADTAQGRSSLAYDSAERREDFAKSLDGKATESTIRARLIADMANAEPARNAVKTGTRHGPQSQRRAPAAPRDRGLSR